MRARCDPLGRARLPCADDSGRRASFRSGSAATTPPSVPGTLEIAARRCRGERPRQRRPHPRADRPARDRHTRTMRTVIPTQRGQSATARIHLAQGARETGPSPSSGASRPCAGSSPRLRSACVQRAHGKAAWTGRRDGPCWGWHGVVFSHCPSAGAGGESMPYRALSAGVAVNISIDTSNDYVENLKLAVLYGQAREALLRRVDPRALERPSIWTAVSTTLGAGRRPAPPRSWTVRAGARADLTVIGDQDCSSAPGRCRPSPAPSALRERHDGAARDDRRPAPGVRWPPRGR